MVTDFVHDLRHADLPAPVRAMARRCLLDLIGVAAAATRTDLARIVHGFVAAQFGAGQGAGGARMLFDDRPVSPAGAALAGAASIDAVDAHDGYRPSKGHAGCSVLPAALAFAEAEGREDGAEFLTALVLGYEIACRAGEALHGSVADYHTSGAWGAVACSAIGARTLGLDRAGTREALGIAEYHGPRSQMMRCIDHPTMVKDGSGWGALAGVAAAYLARDGFTGAPAVTVEGPALAHHWSDLGSRWLILEQYFKPQPVCRWAQSPIHAVLELRRRHGLTADDVARIEVRTFHEAVRLHTRRPETTEQAQYSLPFPVAAAMVHGRVGPAEIAGAALADPAVVALSDRIEMIEDPRCNAAFPKVRLAEVAVVTRSGARLESGLVEPVGDPERPLSDAEIDAKFHAYADPIVGAARSGRIRQAVAGIESGGLPRLLAELGSPPAEAGAALTAAE
jgi:2-methylcitrate dehydratase PrpD